MRESQGALHLRNNVINEMNGTQLAIDVERLGVKLSMEAGGYLCQKGGRTSAMLQIEMLQNYTREGGVLSFWLIESVFSRMRGGCGPNYPLSSAMKEVCEYATTVHEHLPDTELWLYDALPHYSVGSEWPPNMPPGHGQYSMDLPTILGELQSCLKENNVTLVGYQADCPEEYSANYTLPGRGYEKVAAAYKAVTSLGLQFGKTFNSQQGGETSDSLFFSRTTQDFNSTADVVPVTDMGIVMVETWYLFPADIIPEDRQFTTAYTANAVFQHVIDKRDGH